MSLKLTPPLPLTVSGIPDEKLVEAHGSFATASCHLCYTPFPAQEAKVNRDKGHQPMPITGGQQNIRNENNFIHKTHKEMAIISHQFVTQMNMDLIQGLLLRIFKTFKCRS